MVWEVKEAWGHEEKVQERAALATGGKGGPLPLPPPHREPLQTGQT